jgi:hypothetical protein
VFLTDGKLGLPAKDNIPSMVTSFALWMSAKRCSSYVPALAALRAILNKSSGDPE